MLIEVSFVLDPHGLRKRRHHGLKRVDLLRRMLLELHRVLDQVVHALDNGGVCQSLVTVLSRRQRPRKARIPRLSLCDAPGLLH